MDDLKFIAIKKPKQLNLQAKYDDESAETLERVKRQILVDLSEDLKTSNLLSILTQFLNLMLVFHCMS